MRGELLFFTRNTNIHRILLFIYLYYILQASGMGNHLWGTAGIVVICLRLFESYSSRGIRKEWFTPYIVGTDVFPLTTLFHVIFVYKTYPRPLGTNLLPYLSMFPWLVHLEHLCACALSIDKSPDGKSDRSCDRF